MNDSVSLETILEPGSKYTIPDISDTIKRERLFSLFEINRKKKVFLVLGQAAQGKSTLVASYLKESKEKTVWLHLDHEDSDHTNLFYLILNAFNQTLDNDIFHAMEYPQVTLGTRQEIARHRDILYALFSTTSTRVNIVMDDLESLDSEASSFNLIQGVIKDMPRHIRLFLISRKMPPLSIQKLKIKKMIFVLENKELAFTIEETDCFFSAKQKNKISFSQIKKIHTITDGWAGGITLAAEAVNSESDMAKLPYELSCETIDFFSEEIFLNQQKHIRDFLVKSSFFDIIDPEIITNFCDIANPVEILTKLEKRNLFIQRLEQKNNRPVFRFNRLFKDFLENILIAENTKQEYRELCRKAGEIFCNRDNNESAIKYFIKAGSFDKVSQLIKKSGTDMVIKGRFRDLSNWIESLPLETIWRDPWLIYYLTMTRRISGGRQNINDFLTALSLFNEKDDTRGAILCLAHLIEAAVFLQKSSQLITEWITQGENLLISIKDQSLFTYARAVLWQHMGFGLIAGTNDILKGISACKNAYILGKKINNIDLQLNATIVSILGYVHTCDFEEADNALKSISTLTEEGIHPEYRALKNLVKIKLLLKKGELEKTEELLDLSEKDIEKFGLIFLYPGFVEARAMHALYTTNYSIAMQSANHLSDISILAGNNFYSGLSHRIKGTIFYHREDFKQAFSEAKKALKILTRHPRGDIHLFLAKKLLGLILLNQKKFKQAEKELTQALNYFTQFSSTLSQAETSAALGLVMWNNKMENRAEEYITKAIQNAETEGYDHFIIMGPRDFTRALLLKTIFDNNNSSQYIQSLISLKYAQYAQAEIQSLLLLPWVIKRREVKNNLKQFFSYTLPKLRIETFGEFRVFKERKNLQEIQWQGSKPKLLLKSIIIHGKTDIPKEILMEDIWPESSEESGEKKFKINLHRLRKALEPDVKKEFGYFYVKLENGFVSLDPELVSTDIDDFLYLKNKGKKNENKNMIDKALSFYKKAADLYHGDCFCEEPYADWIAQKRDDLKMKYIDILQNQAKLYSRNREKEKSVSCLKKIIQVDPVMESAYQHLMITYADLGMRNSAIQTYKLCKETIKKEIGTEPDVKTIKIYNTIKQLKK